VVEIIAAFEQLVLHSSELPYQMLPALETLQLAQGEAWQRKPRRRVAQVWRRTSRAGNATVKRGTEVIRQLFAQGNGLAVPPGP
jgi:hypothetical protein